MSSRLPNWLIGIMLAAALAGFADASYLTAEHYRGIIPPCTTSGCETVLTSAYAVVAGVPVSVGGIVYYGMLLVFLVAYIDSGSVAALRRAAWATCIGLVTTAYLVWLQLFVIHAICQYCMVSAAMCLILFCTGMVVLHRTRSVVY